MTRAPDAKKSIVDANLLAGSLHVDPRSLLQSFGASTLDEKGKHGPMTTIFSTWNSIVGMGLVVIPWAYTESGLLLGLALTGLCFTISFSTQYMVMKTAKKDLDYTDTMRKTFG